MLCQSVSPLPDLAVIEDSASLNAAIVRLHSHAQITTALSDRDAPDRHELEAFIHKVFKDAYGADIRHYLPLLLSLRNRKGALLAVCGFRRGNEAPLFLEQYLQGPVEQVLGEKLGEAVNREQLIEVGNLAIGNPRHGRILLAAVSLFLHTQTEWAVFTATASLCNGLSKLNLQLVELGRATIDSIPEAERAAWGSYYDERPMVMAIRRRGFGA
jgi:hypothetical protein